MKKLFAIISLTCVLLVSAVIPCFAYVDSEDNPTTQFNEAGRALAVLTTSEVNRYSARNLLTAVDRAYTLGLFGGACPIMVRVAGGYIQVFCLPPSSAMGLPREYGAYVSETTSGSSTSWVFQTINSAGNEVSIQLSRFTMTYDGSFTVGNSASLTDFSGLLARREDGEWDTSGWDSPGWISLSSGNSTPSWISNVNETYARWLEAPLSTEDAYNEGYNAGMESGFLAGRAEGESTGYESGYDDGVLQGYQQGYEQGDREGYERGYDAGYFDGSPTTLNVPSIFDAMFDGVQSIFRSVDIEIFGISILGTLIGVLVICIVAFVVRRLMR